MAVNYTIGDYMGLFMTIVIGFLVVTIAVMVLGLRMLIARKKNTVVGICVAGASIVLSYLLLFEYALPRGEKTFDLLVKSEYEIMTTAGTVETITPVEKTPPYYINKKFCGADYVTIDGENFYVISEGLLSEGMLIEIQYARYESNVILGWQEVTHERAEQVLRKAEEKTPAKDLVSTEVPRWQINLGGWLYYVGFVSFLAVVAISRLFGDRFALMIFKRDAAVYGGIFPNRISAVAELIPFVLLSMIMAGLVIENSEYAIIILFAVGGSFLVWITIHEQWTRLEIDGSVVTVRRFGKEYRYSVTDVRSLIWRSGERGTTGKTLVIRFSDGRAWEFNMDSYRGVQNTYNALSGFLEDET